MTINRIIIIVILLRIFLRFISRIKEAVHGFVLKANSTPLGIQLKAIEGQLKQVNKNYSKTKQLLYKLLLAIPQNFESLQSSQHISQKFGQKLSMVNQEFSSIQNNAQLPSQNKNSFKISKNSNTHFKQSYDRYLEKLSIEFKNMDCLMIDQSDYRKNYFLGQRDHTRNDDNLYSEMIERNSNIKNMIFSYASMFSRYNAKKSKQKIKSGQKLQNKNISLSTNSNNYSVNSALNDFLVVSTHTAIQTHQRQLLSNSSTKQTHINLNITNGQNQVNKVYNNDSKYFKKKQQQRKICSFKDRDLHQNQNEDYEKLESEYEEIKSEFLMNAKCMAAERQKVGNNLPMSVLPLKKVEFKNKRLELGPQHILAKQNPHTGNPSVQKTKNKASILDYNNSISFNDKLIQQKSRKNLEDKLYFKSRFKTTYSCSNKQSDQQNPPIAIKSKTPSILFLRKSKFQLDENSNKYIEIQALMKNQQSRNKSQIIKEVKRINSYQSKSKETRFKHQKTEPSYTINSNKYRCLIIDYEKMSRNGI